MRLKLVGSVVLASVSAIFAGSGVLAGPIRSLPGLASVQRDAGWMAPDANPRDPWLYVDSNQNHIVLIYDLAKFGIPQIGQISQGITSSTALALDSSGTLYVSNYYGANIEVYPAGATSPSATITQDLIIPNGLAIDAHGDLYVANKSYDAAEALACFPGCPMSQTSPQSSILVFPPGQTSPSQTITSSLIKNPGQLFFDTGGNLYISDSASGDSEIPFGSQQPVSLNLEGLTSWTGAVAVDPLNGNLFTSGNYENEQSVLVYPPGTVSPQRRLKTTAFADFLCFGKVRGIEYVFLPDSASNTVTAFRHDSNKAAAAFATVQYARACAYKPANVP